MEFWRFACIALMFSSLACASTVWHQGGGGSGDAGNFPSDAEVTLGIGTLPQIDGSLGNRTNGADACSGGV